MIYYIHSSCHSKFAWMIYHHNLWWIRVKTTLHNVFKQILELYFETNRQISRQINPVRLKHGNLLHENLKLHFVKHIEKRFPDLLHQAYNFLITFNVFSDYSPKNWIMCRDQIPGVKWLEFQKQVEFHAINFMPSRWKAFHSFKMVRDAVLLKPLALLCRKYSPVQIITKRLE